MIMEIGKIVKYLVWVCETKTHRKSKITLHGYRHNLHKNRRHFRWHCKRCWNKIDPSNYELDGLKGKNKKVIGLMKGELGRKIMTKISALRTKNIQLFKRW